MPPRPLFSLLSAGESAEATARRAPAATADPPVRIAAAPAISDFDGSFRFILRLSRSVSQFCAIVNILDGQGACISAAACAMLEILQLQPKEMWEWSGLSPVLYGYRYSVYLRIARIVLTEKGVTHSQVEVNPFAADMPKDYLDLHPFRRVPTLVHGDFVVYETEAITR